MHHRVAAMLAVELSAVQKSLHARLSEQRGQGTVEYVALILLVAGVLAAVVAWARKTGDNGIGAKIVKALKDSIEGVGVDK